MTSNGLRFAELEFCGVLLILAVSVFCIGCSDGTEAESVQSLIRTKISYCQANRACREVPREHPVAAYEQTGLPGKEFILKGYRFLVPTAWQLVEANTVEDELRGPYMRFAKGDSEVTVMFREYANSYMSTPNQFDLIDLGWLEKLGLKWQDIVLGYRSDRKFWEAVFNTKIEDVDVEKIVGSLERKVPAEVCARELVRMWMLGRKRHYGVARRFKNQFFSGFKCTRTFEEGSKLSIRVLMFDSLGRLAGELAVSGPLRSSSIVDSVLGSFEIAKRNHK